VKVVFELKIPLSPLLPASEWPASKNAAQFFRKFYLLIMKGLVKRKKLTISNFLVKKSALLNNRFVFG
jgi:hypothetical protein